MAPPALPVRAMAAIYRPMANRAVADSTLAIRKPAGFCGGPQAECGHPGYDQDDERHRGQAEVDDQLHGQHPRRRQGCRGQPPQDAELAVAGQRYGQAEQAEPGEHQRHQDGQLDVEVGKAA